MNPSLPNEILEMIAKKIDINWQHIVEEKQKEIEQLKKRIKQKETVICTQKYELRRFQHQMKPSHNPGSNVQQYDDSLQNFVGAQDWSDQSGTSWDMMW